MKTILNFFKKYKYKTITAFGLVLLLAILNSQLSFIDFSVPIVVLFSTIFIGILYAFWCGVRNLWLMDDNKVGAIISGVFGASFLTLLTYLLIANF